MKHTSVISHKTHCRKCKKKYKKEKIGTKDEVWTCGCSGKLYPNFLGDYFYI